MIETVDAIALADSEDLFEQLGKLLLGDGFGVGGQDPEEFRRFGRKWLEEKSDELREALCGHPVVKQLGGDLTGDITDVSLLLVNFSNNNQILAWTIAGIIVRRGVARLCEPIDQ